MTDLENGPVELGSRLGESHAVQGQRSLEDQGCCGCGGAVELDVGEASPYFTSSSAIGSRETQPQFLFWTEGGDMNSFPTRKKGQVHSYPVGKGLVQILKQ